MLRRLAVVALALLMAAPALAQDTPYSLSGQVLDQEGDPVAGVAVYLYQYGYAAGETNPDEPKTATATSASSEPSGSSGVATEPARPISEGHEAKTQTDADGRWSLPARAGDASLNFVKEGHASAYEYLQVEGDAVLDVELLRYPDASVHLTGSFSGAPGSISIQYPEYGLYVCSQSDAYDEEPRPLPADTMAPSEGSAESTMIAPGEPYPGRGCAITVDEDGSFEGDIYPGYAIVRAYAESWRSESRTEYYPFVETRVFSGDVQLDIAFRAKPAPDAVFGGYVLGTGDAPLQAQLSFSNLDNYGWGQAETDKDGSFKVALHSGLTEVNIWAEGHLPWSGLVEVADEQLDFVVRLTPGESHGGGCCFAYAEGVAMPASGAAQGESDNDLGAAESRAASGFEDLGGGLGAYEPSDEDAPGFAVIGLLVGLLALARLRRR